MATLKKIISSHIFRGKLISCLFPSGMYEVYLDKEKGFRRFDSLGAAQGAICRDEEVANKKDETDEIDMVPGV